jgi:hypothetical protein
MAPQPGSQRCGACREEGHNRRNCPRLLMDGPPTIEQSINLDQDVQRLKDHADDSSRPSVNTTTTGNTSTTTIAAISGTNSVIGTAASHV